MRVLHCAACFTRGSGATHAGRFAGGQVADDVRHFDLPAGCDRPLRKIGYEHARGLEAVIVGAPQCCPN